LSSEKVVFFAENSERVDKFLSTKLEVSRNQIEKLISGGFVEVSNKIVKKSGLKLSINDEVSVQIPEPEKKESEFEIDFDVPILYEDDSLLVINKPPNLVVHSAPSVKEATLVDWLKKRGISLSTISGEERHGIVHRLDKGTTGAMVVAKDNFAHQKLSEQLSNRTMGRNYFAILNMPLKDDTSIELPIARNPKNRLKMGVVDGGKWAKTDFKKLKISKNEKEEFIEAKLHTGRTHQIRVHLLSLQRYILGDELYGFGKSQKEFPHLLLHAHKIYFEHPKTGKKVEVKAPLSKEFQEYLDKNF
jgi:23S rRNA pseudouridine1911/1915/1917 synthase